MFKKLKNRGKLMFKKLKNWWNKSRTCKPEGAPWYKFKKKHKWSGLFNKHGTMYRRVCVHCRYYEDRSKGKWKGYSELKLHKDFVGISPKKK